MFRSALLLGFLIWLAAFEARTQPGPTSPQADALMQLMLSQAPVDIHSPVTARVVFDPPVIGV